MMKKLAIFAFCTCIAVNSLAIEIKEALEKAYEHNPQLKASQQDFMAAIQGYPAALGGFLPDVSLSSTDSNQKQTPISRPGQPDTNSNYNKSLNFRQNLFKGGSDTANIAAAKHGADAAKLSYINQEQTFLLNAINTYIDVLVARESFAASKQLLDSATTQYNSAIERLNVGEATKTDVAQFKAQLAQASFTNAANNAKLQAVSGNFKTFFGFPAGDISMPEAPSDLPKDFDEFRAKGMSSNLSIRSAYSQVKQTKNSALSEKAKLLPSVDVTASTGRGEQPNRNGTISKNRSYTTSLQVTVPIFQQGGSEYARIRQANAQSRKAVNNQELAKLQTETQIISDWQSYLAAKESVTFAQDALEANKLAYEGMKSSYEVGNATVIDLLAQEQKLYESTVQNIQYKQQYIKTAYTIKSDLAQLTAKDLGLKVKLFDPDAEFRKTKFKVIGF